MLPLGLLKILSPHPQAMRLKFEKVFRNWPSSIHNSWDQWVADYWNASKPARQPEAKPATNNNNNNRGNNTTCRADIFHKNLQPFLVFCWSWSGIAGGGYAIIWIGYPHPCTQNNHFWDSETIGNSIWSLTPEDMQKVAKFNALEKWKSENKKKIKFRKWSPSLQQHGTYNVIYPPIFSLQKR